MLIASDIYEIIKKNMPIPCVDLVVVDKDKKILMLKRKNDPAKGKWWFPGGRVHFNEPRTEAVKRKAKKECGLDITKIRELGTKDLILHNSDATLSHAITTVFLVRVEGTIVLDEQSESFEYKTAKEWLSSDIDLFLKHAINEAEGFLDER